MLLEATRDKQGGRSVTIAGDTAQRLVFDNDFPDWTTHLRAAGHDAALIRPLRLSYRSTAEVMRFARAILGPLADPDEPLVARNGAPVELSTSASSARRSRSSATRCARSPGASRPPRWR